MSGSDFWTRRKAKVEAERQQDEQKAEQAVADEELRALEEKSDEEILAELNLPDPDTLETGDDFKAFLNSAVPQRLKRVALRRLWASNPVLANLDGLVEYGEDYTDASTVVENLMTTYQVGKGMAKHVEEMARQAELEAAADALDEEEPTDIEGTEEADGEEPSQDPSEEQLENQEVIAAEQHSESPEEDDISISKRKRMRYKFPQGQGGAA
ncbi:MAG: DUF3306 domain-containing protein [Boseongicola sp.]|nr:DUF3306 domain-containing protein [Boseongicola sp.]MDD9977177.1 DUF3306 domain-containing protein [Boseongicola sp.]